MSKKPLLALAALVLILPVAAHAETMTRSEATITHDPGAVPPGTKSTLVLKGYKVRTGYTMPSAPVAGEPGYTENEVFVPVEDMVDMPLPPEQALSRCVQPEAGPPAKVCGQVTNKPTSLRNHKSPDHSGLFAKVSRANFSVFSNR